MLNLSSSFSMNGIGRNGLTPLEELKLHAFGKNRLTCDLRDSFASSGNDSSRGQADSGSNQRSHLSSARSTNASSIGQGDSGSDRKSHLASARSTNASSIGQGDSGSDRRSLLASARSTNASSRGQGDSSGSDQRSELSLTKSITNASSSSRGQEESGSGHRSDLYTDFSSNGVQVGYVNPSQSTDVGLLKRPLMDCLMINKQLPSRTSTYDVRYRSEKFTNVTSSGKVISDETAGKTTPVEQRSRPTTILSFTDDGKDHQELGTPETNRHIAASGEEISARYEEVMRQSEKLVRDLRRNEEEERTAMDRGVLALSDCHSCNSDAIRSRETTYDDESKYINITKMSQRNEGVHDENTWGNDSTSGQISKIPDGEIAKIAVNYRDMDNKELNKRRLSLILHACTSLPPYNNEAMGKRTTPSRLETTDKQIRAVAGITFGLPPRLWEVYGFENKSNLKSVQQERKSDTDESDKLALTCGSSPRWMGRYTIKLNGSCSNYVQSPERQSEKGNFDELVPTCGSSPRLMEKYTMKSNEACSESVQSPGSQSEKGNFGELVPTCGSSPRLMEKYTMKSNKACSESVQSPEERQSEKGSFRELAVTWRSSPSWFKQRNDINSNKSISESIENERKLGKGECHDAPAYNRYRLSDDFGKSKHAIDGSLPPFGYSASRFSCVTRSPQTDERKVGMELSNVLASDESDCNKEVEKSKPPVKLTYDVANTSESDFVVLRSGDIVETGQECRNSTATSCNAYMSRQSK